MGKKISYFIAYTFTDGHNLGSGRCGCTRDKPITSIEDIAEISETLERTGGLIDVVITNWRRFEEAE